MKWKTINPVKRWSVDRTHKAHFKMQRPLMNEAVEQSLQPILCMFRRPRKNNPEEWQNEARKEHTSIRVQWKWDAEANTKQKRFSSHRRTFDKVFVAKAVCEGHRKPLAANSFLNNVGLEALERFGASPLCPRTTSWMKKVNHQQPTQDVTPENISQMAHNEKVPPTMKKTLCWTWTPLRGSNLLPPLLHRKTFKHFIFCFANSIFREDSLMRYKTKTRHFRSRWTFEL